MEQEKQTETEEIHPIIVFLAAIGLIGLGVWGLNSIWNGTGDTSSKGESTVASECLEVPDLIVTRLNNDSLNIGGGGSIIKLQAVKSKDFSSVYFVSGELEGPGLEGDGDIATFIVNKLDSSGLTFSADTVATEFSDWPDIATTNLLGEGGVSRGVVISSDGYDESRDCVSNS